MTHFPRSVLSLAICTVLGSSYARAASTGLVNTDKLEEVVVTASRAKERVFDSAATLSVITEQEIDRAIAPSLAETLRDIAGVQVNDAGQPGQARIRIRGEESRRTAVLVNSQEVTDHHEIGTPLSLNPAMIERIEVVRGSGAVLYGSRALSGVVNFITRKGGTEPVQATLSGSYDSATEGYTGFASLYGNLDGFEYRVAGSTSDYGDRSTPAGMMPNTSYENDSLYLYAGKSFAAQRFEYTYEDYRASSETFVEEAVKNTFPLTDFSIDTPRRDRRKHGLFYEWSADNDWLQSLVANAYHQVSERHFYTFTETAMFARDVNSKDTLITDGALLQFNFQPWGRHSFTAGLQYLDDEVDQARYVDTVFQAPVPSGSEVIDDEASITTWAWFLQDVWQVGERWSLTAGLRQYFVDGDLIYSNRDSLNEGELGNDSELIGALGLVWDYSQDVRLRMNVSQGYVYPSLLQLATGAYAGSSFVNPNASLQPESSINYETGIRLQKNSVEFDLTAFYTQSKDYIGHQPCAPEDNCPGSRDRIYVNIGESVAYGVEMFVAYSDGPWGVQPYANLTWMQRRNEFEGFSTLNSGVPAVAGRAGLRWEGALASVPWVWTDFYLRGESSSDIEEPATVRSELDAKAGWLTANLAAGVDLGARRQYQLALQLLNLNNKTYIASGENLYGAERSVAVKLTLNF